MENKDEEPNWNDFKKDPEIREIKNIIRGVLIAAMVMLLLTTVLSVFGWSNNNLKISAVEDLNYNFYDDILYTNTNFTEPNLEFNFRDFYNATTTGFYNATYTFTDEVGDIGTQIDLFTGDISDANCIAEVVSGFTTHDEIVNFTDTNNLGDLDMISSLGVPALADTTFEFWFAKNITGANTEALFDFDEFGTNKIQLRFEDDDLQYWFGGWNNIKTNFLVPDQWYHISIRMDDTLNEFDIYVDEILEGNNIGYIGTTSLGINVMKIQSSISNGDYEFYIDAVGITQYDTDYNIGDNLLPFVNSTFDRREPAYRDEFAFDRNGVSNEPLSSITDTSWGWYEDEFDDDDVVITDTLFDSEPWDRDVEIWADSVGYRYIKNDYWSENGTYDFELRIPYIHMDNPDSWFFISIFSYDNTEIISLRIELRSTTVYFEYFDVSYQPITSWPKTELIVNRTLELTIHETFGSNDVELHYFDTEARDVELTFDKQADKLGIRKIYVYGGCNDADSFQFMRVDSATLFVNDTGIVHDFSFIGFNMSIDEWSPLEYNLFTIQGLGNFSIGVYGNETSYSINPIQEINGTYLFNILDETWGFFDYVPFPTITFIINNTGFNITSVEVAGVKLVHNSNSYIPTYQWNNISIDNSYWYVEGDRLRFSLTTSTTELEFIQIDFNIPNFVAEIYSLLWGGIKSEPQLFGEWRINYADDTYSAYPLLSVLQYRGDLLSVEKIVDDITFIISDNDNDVNSTNLGFFESIIFVYNPSVHMDITITSYLTMIPAILIMSTITLTIWQITKKTVGPMLIIPSIALTAGLSYITDFMPLWMLFVVLICCGVLVYAKWENLFMVFSSFATMITGFMVYGDIIPLWVFYSSFLLTMAYVIFSGIGGNNSGGE